jgi:RHS repeat-associated protein
MREEGSYTNFDYMHFRYYASSIGRFLKPDNVIQNLYNPQSWNLYSYVHNNPVNFNDPSGHDNPDPIEQSVKVNTSTGNVPTSNASAPPPNDSQNLEMKKKETENPFGDFVLKTTLDFTALAAEGAVKTSAPTKAEAKVAEEWGLMTLKQPELKAIGKIAGTMSAVLDTVNIYQNLKEPRSCGSGMSSKETKRTLLEISEGVAVLGVSLYLMPETGLASSIPAIAAVGSISTNVGKLINANLDFEKPTKHEQADPLIPNTWIISGGRY